MTYRRLAIAVLVFSGLAGPALAIDVDNPPIGTFSDDWYVVLMKGSKSGHAHSTMRRTQRSDGDVITCKTDMVLEISRAGQSVGVRVIQQTDESLDGRPLGFSNSMRLGAFPGTSSRGTIANGKVRVSTNQFGQQTEPEEYKLPTGAMMTWAVYREQMKRGLKPGDKFELSAYEPSITPGRITPMSVEIMDREMVDLFGRKVQAFKSRQVMHLTNMLGQKSDVATTSWITQDGNVVRSEMSIMDIPIEIIAATKSVAMSPNQPAELMVDTLIPVDKPVDSNADRVTYLLTLKKKNDQIRLSDLPETGMQWITRRGASEVELTVSRRSARAGGPGNKQPAGPHPVTLTSEERARYLAASSVLNYKDPAVADLAKQAAGDEKDPIRLAERLCRFVSQYVEDKNLSIGFATASEVARSKEGDCTEHAVLLAALGRAAGFPTRVVTGIVYARRFGGKKSVFVGHMWAQFWIDGQWVDVDAALGQPVVEPTHIALSLSDAGDSGIADMVNSVWLNLGQIEVSVLDRPTRSTTTRPATQATAGPSTPAPRPE
jgi:hypothetical protein